MFVRSTITKLLKIFSSSLLNKHCFSKSSVNVKICCFGIQTKIFLFRFVLTRGILKNSFIYLFSYWVIKYVHTQTHEQAHKFPEAMLYILWVLSLISNEDSFSTVNLSDMTKSNTSLIIKEEHTLPTL